MHIRVYAYASYGWRRDQRKDNNDDDDDGDEQGQSWCYTSQGNTVNTHRGYKDNGESAARQRHYFKRPDGALQRSFI